MFCSFKQVTMVTAMHCKQFKILTRPKTNIFNSPLHNTLVGPYTDMTQSQGCSRCPTHPPPLPPWHTCLYTDILWHSHTAAATNPSDPTLPSWHIMSVSALTSYDSHTAAATNPSDPTLPSWHIMSVSALPAIQVTVYATVLQQTFNTHLSVSTLPSNSQWCSKHSTDPLNFSGTCLSMHFHLYTHSHTVTVV